MFWILVAMSGLVAALPAISLADAQDPLSWLDGGEPNARAAKWIGAETARTIRELKGAPGYAARHQAAQAVLWGDSQESTLHNQLHGEWVYNVETGVGHPRGLWRRATLESFMDGVPIWQPLLDLDALNRAERKDWVFFHANVKWQPRGARCLIHLLERSGELATLREFDLDRREFVKDGFTIPLTYLPSAEWKNDDALIVAMDFGPGTVSSVGSPLVVKQWSRGQPLSSAVEIFRGRDSDWGVSLRVEGNGQAARSIVLEVGRPDYDNQYWVMTPQRSKPQLMTTPPGAALYGRFNDTWIFYLENRDSTVARRTFRKGSLISIRNDAIDQPEPVVEIVMEPKPREVIQDVRVGQDGLLILSLVNVRARLWRAQHRNSTWCVTPVPMPDNGSMSWAMNDVGGKQAFIVYENFIEPPTLYAIHAAESRSERIRSVRPAFNRDPYIVEQLEAISRDGTRVPYFLVRPRTLKANGAVPTLLHAYGNAGGKLDAKYDPILGRLWLEQGGIYVQANIRGGGELGPEWHVVKTERARTYEDTVAVAQDLFQRRITSPKHLGIRGHSMGGTLAGVMFTQHPELFNAFVSENPVIDQLNRRAYLNGKRVSDDAVADPEWGSLDVPEERAFLESTSPYQNLRKRADAAPFFIATSTTDSGIPPEMARKFAFKLGALGMPFHFWESPASGHEPCSTPQECAQYEALVYTYLAERLMASAVPR